MPFTITAQKKSNYLLVRVSGTIENLEEHKLMDKQVADEIFKHDINKVIVNELPITSSQSYSTIINTAYLVDFYIQAISDRLKLYQIAAVVKKDLDVQGYFWETYARNRGYNVRIFYTMEDALKYTNED